MTRPQDASRVRWRNRLAAWIYGMIGERLIDLAIPVWDEAAERDLREAWEEDERQEALARSMRLDAERRLPF